MKYKNIGGFTLGTLVSRILGLVRESTIAILLGASRFSDAFYVAFRIPNLFRDILAENALQNAFIPTYIEAKEKRQHPERFLGSILGLLLLVGGALSLMGIIFAPLFVKIFAPGFTKDPFKFDLTVKLTQITFPFLLLVALAALLSALLNTYKKFFLPALSPAFFNIGSILMGVVAYFALPFNLQIYAILLAWGLLLGGLLQFLVQIPPVLRLKLLPPLLLEFKHPAFKKFLKLFTSVFLNTTLSRVTLFVNTFIASFLAHGSISYLSYAYRIMQLPIGLFGVGIATVSLPEMAQKTSPAELSTSYSKALRTTILLSFPFTIFLFLYAEKIVALLFQRGSFTFNDTYSTCSALLFYLLSVVPTGISRILLNLYFSQGNTKIPNRVFVVSGITNVLSALLLVSFLDFAALALATSIATIVQSLLLLVFKDHRIKLRDEEQHKIVKILALNLILIGILFLNIQYFGTWSFLTGLLLTPIFYLGGIFFLKLL